MFSDYIDLKVVGQVIGTGVVLGAGLPLVFALGLRALSSGTEQGAGGTATVGGFTMSKNPAALAVGALCLLVVVGAIAFGIYIITHKS